MLTTSLRRFGAALAAVAIGLPALAVTTASAAPVLDPALTPAVGTTWTDGPCAVGTGVTVVADHQGDADPVVRCVTNEDERAYSSENALQTFADAGVEVRTQTSQWGPMVCMVDGAPDPCGQWPGDWWSFWTGSVDGGWTSASAGAHDTSAAADSFIGLSLAGAQDTDAPAPRVETTLANAEEPPAEEPPAEEPPAEEDPDDKEPVEPDAAVVAAAGFVARELRAQDHLIVNWGFNDYGLTTDFALALVSAGLYPDDAAAAAAKVAETVHGYIGADGETYAGAVAKSLVLALALGMDPTDFGGVDLVATLQSREQTSGADPGRFSDASAYGDYSNTLVQAFAVLGLEGAGVGASQAAVDYLVSAQCNDGGFALNTGGTQCASDPDATALAVQALLVSPCATDASLAAALDYLVALQADSGGFGGGATTEGVNANSTGLVGATLAAAGIDAAAGAVDYLLTMQYDATFPATLQGGFAYDATVLAARAAAGAGATVADQDRRTTAQAVVGLTGTSYADLVGAFANAPDRDCEVLVPEPVDPKPVDPKPVDPTDDGSAGGPDGPDGPDGSDDAAGPGDAGAPAPPTTAPTTAPTPKPATGLAQTGSEVAPFALLAVLLVLAGGGVVVATRQRGASQ